MLALAAAIAAGDAFVAERGVFVLRDGAAAGSTWVVAPVLAADGLAGLGVLADDQVVLRGAAELVACALIRKALPGTARVAQRVAHPAQFVLALGTGSGRSGGQTPGVAPRSAPASRARQAVRRDPAVPKRRVIRSKVWWSIALILRSECAKECRYIVMANFASSHAMGEILVVMALKTELTARGLV